MNRRIRTATLALLTIAIGTLFTSCSTDTDNEEHARTSMEQIRKNMEGTYTGTLKTDNKLKNWTVPGINWTLSKDIITFGNFPFEKLAVGVSNSKSSLHKALDELETGDLKVYITNISPSDSYASFTTGADLSCNINLDGKQVKIVASGTVSQMPCTYEMRTSLMMFNFTVNKLQKDTGHGSFEDLKDFDTPTSFTFTSHLKN